MGLFHKHDYKPERTEHQINGAFVKETKVVKCAKLNCSKEGVSGVNTKLNPVFRDAIIDRQ